MIAEVIVDHRSRMVDKAFDYLIPDSLENQVAVGTRVLVPFSRGNNVLEGFCVGIKNEKPLKNTKEIIRIANDTRAFDEKMLETIEFMHSEYFAPYLDIIHTVVPSGTDTKSSEWIEIADFSAERSEIRKKILECLADNGGGMEKTALSAMMGRNINTQIREMIKNGTLRKKYYYSNEIHEKTQRAVKLCISTEQAAREAEKLEKKAPVQARMLEILSANEFIAIADLRKFSGGSYNAVTALCQKGFIKAFDLTIERNPLADKEIVKSEKLTLTDEQSTAVESICDVTDKGEFAEFLLHGVTGSGKTEVFMQAIERVIKYGKTALVLVPEISLTPQMVSRFLNRFGSRIAVFHSRLSMGERYDQWLRIRRGDADIVIGARSAVFAPLENLGIIIIDEEHSDTYKSEMSPRYDAKEVAAFRAKQFNAAVVYASATPSAESMYKAETGSISLLTMKKRCNSGEMPRIAVVDMRAELDGGNRSMFSNLLVNELKKNIENGEQSILFLNRRGFSTFVSCRSCGYTAECPNCSISLTYHKYGNFLKCHYCGYTIPNYTLCPQCKSKYIRYFGGGTQRVETEIQKLFPGISTLRMDVDTTGKKESHEKILEQFEKEKTDVLIGTQMVSKGLDFENVTLVGVISADTMLHINDYRSAERTFSMLEQVTGRAGRGSKKGRAVIQTYSPEAEAIQYAKIHNYGQFYRTEIEKRRLMWYPPFSDIITVMFSGASESLVPQAAKYFMKLLGNLEDTDRKIQVLGPVPSSVSKIKNKYRWQIIFKCEDGAAISERIKKAVYECAANKAYSNISIVADKNPTMIY